VVRAAGASAKVPPPPFFWAVSYLGVTAGEIESRLPRTRRDVMEKHKPKGEPKTAKKVRATPVADKKVDARKEIKPVKPGQQPYRYQFPFATTP
jgi:hypothetical protein